MNGEKELVKKAKALVSPARSERIKSAEFVERRKWRGA